MIPKKRTVSSVGLWSVYGILFAIALVGLKFVELSYMSNRIGTEVYIMAIAIGFLATGLAIGGRRDPVHQNNHVAPAPSPAKSERSGDLVADHELSPRELEVLALVAQGKTNKQIADALFLSAHTIKSHVANICRKLEVERRGQAVARARERNIIP